MKSISIKTMLMACFVLTICGCEQNQNTPDDSNSNVKGFTVEDGRQVVFAPGNLQYQASTKTWRFAGEQYDYIGEDNEEISYTYSGWIDLFAWATGNTPTQTNSSDNSKFIDWGQNAIGTDPKNTWRTLTGDEWNYIITYRPNAPKLFGFAAVKGISGLILLPDDWTVPDGIEFNPGQAKYTNNLYSSAQWKQMEAAGAVFLPAAGYRRYDEYFKCEKYYGDGYDGSYWSSSPANLNFNTFGINVYWTNYGCSVRLAKDL